MYNFLIESTLNALQLYIDNGFYKITKIYVSNVSFC